MLAALLAMFIAAVSLVTTGNGRSDAGTSAVASGPAGTDPAYACRQDVHPQDPDYPGVHVASLAEAPNGDVLYTFYAGTREGADDVATYQSRLRTPVRGWAEPRVIFDEPDRPDGNAVLWVDGGTTYLFFSTIMGEGWTDAELRMISSEDSGHTWSEPEQIREEWGWLFGTRPFRMSNGEVIVPIYDEVSWSSGWYLPGEDYTSWVPLPSDDEAQWPTSPNGAIQPATVELDDGHLLTYMRTRDGAIYQTESFDYGRTWTEAERTDLPNNDARVDLIKLDSGNLLLAYNPTEDDRDVLRLSLSEDDGQTWSHHVDVENDPSFEFSYPYLIQSDNGEIHLGYTHRRESMRHLVFNEAYVRFGEALPSEPEYGVTEFRHGEIRDGNRCVYPSQSRDLKVEATS